MNVNLNSWAGSIGRLWSKGLRPVRSDRQSVDEIRARAELLRELTDLEIADRTQQLRNTIGGSTTVLPRDHLLNGFALCTEAARRALGISFYDVQLLAGLALTQGKIAEMQTGEGKTFVAALPAFIHSLSGKGVHVLTVNDYLAQRDFELMSPVFERLGLKAGFLQQSSSEDDKRQAYACDITYGPGYEFGFDYLRDQAAILARGKPKLGQQYRDRLLGEMSNSPSPVQRGFSFCVIDEVDSVLIDEGTTPLLLSGSSPQSETASAGYSIAHAAARELTTPGDFTVDQTGKQVVLTKRGIASIAASGRQAASQILLRPWTVYVRQALHASLLMQRDVDYIVDGSKVLLVDQNTGRICPERSWRDGLHQAVEVKEELSITAEQQPIGHITRQRFFGLYDGMCGMTGTAKGNEHELRHFYGLRVSVIPTRKPIVRRKLPTRYFADQELKFAAITEEIRRIHASQQPILVGTHTIEVSEILAARLEAACLPFRLLNGKQDEEEAQVVAEAGELGAITIATNMAGRGTDIKLGPGVLELGGLHVIATAHHDSARIDRQLVGRAARQGEPGSYQFFVAADDSLICRHAPSLGKRIKQTANDQGESQVNFSTAIAKLQQNVERLGFVQRQQMFAHDRWLDQVLATLAQER